MSSTSKSTISFTVKHRVDLSKLVESGKTFAQVERERAQQLIAKGTARARSKSDHTLERTSVQSITVDNGQVNYSTDVKIGHPSTTYTLMIDTGSGNTWIGAIKPYVPTSTSTKTSNTVSVTYGIGSFSGTEYIDQVALSLDLVIKKQSIGVASVVNNLNSFDGFLGVGPKDLSTGTLSSPDTNSEILTVVDNLLAQGTIPSAVLSVFFEPAISDTTEPTGELTFGATDPTKITGKINYVPITTTSPASEFWGIDARVSYGEKTILKTTAGVVDTGTTLVLLSTEAFKEYKSATGAVLDKATGLLKITEAEQKKLKPLSFHIGRNVYTLSPNAQMLPRVTNTAVGGKANAIYLLVGTLGTTFGQGLEFFMGYAFLSRFYSVYDTSNKRVGLAPTAFTDATTN